jgi:hypothetical protein
MAQSHYLREQAGRRLWRLGKEFDLSVPEEDREVRIYYMAYEGSVAHRKMHKLGLQSGAAQLFNGDTPDGELVKQAGAQHSALAQISRGVAQVGDEDEDGMELATQAELAAAFARRNAERYDTLRRGRSWIGVIDTLPARLAQLRASQATPSVKQAAVVVEPAEPVATLVAAAVEAVAVPTPEPVAAPVTVAEVELVEERAVSAADEPVSTAEPVTPAEPTATPAQPPQWGRPAAARKPRKPTVVSPNQLSLF